MTVCVKKQLVSDRVLPRLKLFCTFSIGIEFLANKELVEYEIQEVALFTTSVILFSISFKNYFHKKIPILLFYFFVNSKICLQVDKISQARARVVFRRRMEYHLSNTIAPTFLLMLVGYLSFFFNVDDFTDRIMVALTSTLVIATLMSSIAEVRYVLLLTNWVLETRVSVCCNYTYYFIYRVYQKHSIGN